MQRRRVLFFAEAVTLAHVARPIVLAKALHAIGVEPVLACHERYRQFTAPQDWETLPLESISAASFIDALAKGRPVYSADTMRSYLAQDLTLIERVKPDLIIGDFRLSLSASARLAGIPYATVCNAYWSPYCAGRRWPLPVLPVTRVLPVWAAQAAFGLMRHAAFAMHCAPLNRVRREHGLPPLRNLCEVYTDADFTLYADAPSMFDMHPLPPEHRFIGPIVWAPDIPHPEWWNRLPTDQPLLYVTLGSSGSPREARKVVQALAELPVTLIVSTAGSEAEPHLPNVFSAKYLPGLAAAARSNLVVCNGGSPTSHQALAAGVPVLGIAANMDQFLNMQAVERAGAGSVIRADRLRPESVRERVKFLLGSDDVRAAAARCAPAHNPTAAPREFSAFIASRLGLESR